MRAVHTLRSPKQTHVGSVLWPATRTHCLTSTAIRFQFVRQCSLPVILLDGHLWPRRERLDPISRDRCSTTLSYSQFVFQVIRRRCEQHEGHRPRGLKPQHALPSTAAYKHAKLSKQKTNTHARNHGRGPPVSSFLTTWMPVAGIVPADQTQGGPPLCYWSQQEGMARILVASYGIEPLGRNLSGDLKKELGIAP